MEQTLPAQQPTFSSEDVRKRRRKKRLIIWGTIVGVIVIYGWFVTATPFDNKKISGSFLGQLGCYAQTFVQNCSVDRDTRCSNLGCVSELDYQRCIVGTRAADGTIRHCSISSTPYIHSKKNEQCRFYTSARTSLEELGFNTGKSNGVSEIMVTPVELNGNASSTTTPVYSTVEPAPLGYTAPLVCENPVHTFTCDCDYLHF